MLVYGEILYPLSDLNEISPQSSSKNLQMIEVSLSLIERDVTKLSLKIRLHWDIRRTVEICENSRTVKSIHFIAEKPHVQV